MSDPFEGRPFPREVLIGAAFLIGFVIVAAAMVRVTGVGRTDLPVAPMVESRQLVVCRQRRWHHDGPCAWGRGVVAELESGVDGFVLGVMRGMVRERKSNSADVDAPYLLSLRENGSLLFEDPLTGRRIDVRSFGPTNAGSFAKLLRAEIRPDP
jgi:putative photosynthetic complex assembly protein